MSTLRGLILAVSAYLETRSHWWKRVRIRQRRRAFHRRVER
jgi:hypothetical protein